MGINKLVFAALTVGCLVAAGLGGFLAVRFGQPPVAADTPDALPASAPATTTPGTVTESEGVITPAPSPAPPVAAAPSPAPAPRAAEPARTRATRESTPSRSASSRPEARPESRRVESAPVRTQEPAPQPPQVTQNSGSMWETRPAIQQDAPPAAIEEPAAPPPPPAPEFVELQVPADSVLGLQVERTVTSDVARVEDKVTARVTRDVRVGNRVAIPAGAIVSGSVTEVDRGGKMKGKARLAVRFHTVTLADGSQMSIRTDAVIREGQSPSGETAAKVGGAAIGGAILGAILGGGKGAAIGAGVGAAGGTAAAMTNDRNPATLPAGPNVTVRVQQPVTVTVTKE
jgi:type IV secretory pathway VirB10-like protein